MEKSGSHVVFFIVWCKISLLANSCLSCCKSCDRNSEGRAGYVIKTDGVTELNRCGVTTVLAADTNVKLGIYGSTKGYCHVHKLTNTGGVKLSEGIVLKDLYYTLAKKEFCLFLLKRKNVGVIIWIS